MLHNRYREFNVNMYDKMLTVFLHQLRGERVSCFLLWTLPKPCGNNKIGPLEFTIEMNLNNERQYFKNVNKNKQNQLNEDSVLTQ